MIHEEISGKIISAAMEMLNELKLRLGEKLYERAMIIELKPPQTQCFSAKFVPVFIAGN